MKKLLFYLSISLLATQALAMEYNHRCFGQHKPSINMDYILTYIKNAYSCGEIFKFFQNLELIEQELIKEPKVIDALVEKIIKKDRCKLNAQFWLNCVVNDSASNVGSTIAQSMIQALVRAGADVNQPINSKVTLLSSAVKLKKIDIIKALLDAGAKVNEESVMEAAYGIYFNPYSACLTTTEIIKLLIERGLDRNDFFYIYKKKNNSPFSKLTELFDQARPQPTNLTQQGVFDQYEKIIQLGNNIKNNSYYDPKVTAKQFFGYYPPKKYRALSLVWHPDKVDENLELFMKIWPNLNRDQIKNKLTEVFKTIASSYDLIK